MSDVTLALTSPHMTGDIVSGCQKDMNARLDAWKVPKAAHVAVDGDWGMESRNMARSILYGLGVDVAGADFDGVSPRDRTKIRHGKEELTKDELARWEDRADWRKRFAKRFQAEPQQMALDFLRAHIGVTEDPPGSNTGPRFVAGRTATESIAAAMIARCWPSASGHAARSAPGRPA